MIVGTRKVDVARFVLAVEDVARATGMTAVDLRALLTTRELTNVSATRRPGIDPDEMVRLAERLVASGQLSDSALPMLAVLIATPAGQPWIG